MKYKMMKGFTLVELLIVIALIAILSVAVLATINPIEQANKARDSRVMNDAAEVMNAYERYYASKQIYPWMEFTNGANGALTLDEAVSIRSETLGFGVCSGAGNAAALAASNYDDAAAECTSADDVPNYLISTSELKSSFAGKDEFEPVRDTSHVEQALWAAKAEASDTIYVCWVPKATANRSSASKNRCITAVGVVSAVGVNGCLAAVAGDYIDDPALHVTSGTEAVFQCVPE